MTYLALFHSALCLPSLITARCPHFSLLMPLIIMVLPLPAQSHLIDSDPLSLLSLFLVHLSHSIQGFISSNLSSQTKQFLSRNNKKLIIPLNQFQKIFYCSISCIWTLLHLCDPIPLPLLYNQSMTPTLNHYQKKIVLKKESKSSLKLIR